MVYRLHMSMAGCRPSIADGACRQRRWPNRASSPVMTPILLLRRSRGAIGRVRATPGAPPTAAASMDGSDGRADGIPGGGKGLRSSCSLLRLTHSTHSIAIL